MLLKRIWISVFFRKDSRFDLINWIGNSIITSTCVVNGVIEDIYSVIVVPARRLYISTHLRYEVCYLLGFKICRRLL